MKPHLPVVLRKVVLACAATVGMTPMMGLHAYAGWSGQDADTFIYTGETTIDLTASDVTQAHYLIRPGDDGTTNTVDAISFEPKNGNQNGTIVANSEGRDISFAGGPLNWNSVADNQPFNIGGEKTSFEAGDNVFFTGDSLVTQSEDIRTTRLVVEEQAVVSVNNSGYAFSADVLTVDGILKYKLSAGEGQIQNLNGSGNLVLENASAEAAAFTMSGNANDYSGQISVKGNTSLHVSNEFLESSSSSQIHIANGAELVTSHNMRQLIKSPHITTDESGVVTLVNTDILYLESNVKIDKNYRIKQDNSKFTLNGYWSANKPYSLFEVCDGTSFSADCNLWICSWLDMQIKGGSVQAEEIGLGTADGYGTYWGKLSMSAGKLTAAAIVIAFDLYSTVNITGGDVEFTAANVLRRENGTNASVRIVGTDSQSPVNLHSNTVDWTLNGTGFATTPVIGNVTIDAGNTHGITLANVALTGSIVNNAELTLGEGISVAANTTTTLSGDGQLSVHRTIANAGTFNLQVSQVSLDRSNLEYLQSGIEGATVRYSYDGTTYNTDGSENGFRFQTDGRYYLVAGGQYTVTQGSQVQLGDEAYELFCDGTGIGFIYPENTRSVEYFVNSGNVVVGAAARELAETYEINGGTMVVNTGSIAGERIHFNTDAAALNIGGASHVTGTLTTTRGTTTVAGGEVDALTSTGGQVHVAGGHIGSLLFSGGSATLSGGSSGSLMVGAATVEVTGMHTTGRVRMSEPGASTVVIKDGGNLTLSGTNNDHSTNRSFMLAHWPYASTLRQEGGLLNSPGATMFISWDGTGTYEAMGGVANLAGISFWGSSSNIRGKFYLGEAEGGTARVNIGANGISDISGSVQILLGNGTLGATADWRMHHNPSFTVSPVQLISTGQGTIFDTSDANYPTIGRTITVDVPFTGIGKLVKQGVGALILNRASTHSGGTVIEAGELVAGNETALGSGKVSLAGGELKLNTELTVGEMEYTGGALNLNGNTLNITRELTASRQLSLNGGILDIENGAIYNGKGIIAQAGTSTAVRVQNAELSQVGYDLIFNAGTALEVAGNSTIRGNVNLLADSLFKLEQAATLSLHETLQADAAELRVQGTALLTGSSTLNASLTLADGATLDMMSLDAGAVTINGALTFGGQVEMGENLQAAVEGLTCYAPGLVLFTGLTDLVLPVAASELESDRVLASSVFSNVANPDLYVTYHVVDNVGSLLVMNVPEPATSTLSLLTLTALAARRRRK